MKVSLRELPYSLSQPRLMQPSKTIEITNIMIDLVRTIMTLIAMMMIAAMMIVIQTDQLLAMTRILDFVLTLNF